MCASRRRLGLTRWLRQVYSLLLNLSSSTARRARVVGWGGRDIFNGATTNHVHACETYSECSRAPVEATGLDQWVKGAQWRCDEARRSPAQHMSTPASGGLG